MQPGDILSDAECVYVQALERLWDMVSDTIEGGRITEADIPDDYQALVMQCEGCNKALADT